MKEQLESPVIVSVQCMAYNHEPYIRECLEGFVMQKTNFRFEAIVHDDASTDGTADIIREYAEKYPDIIKPIFETENQYSKHDGSIERIMNEACIGKYIALCEGDDYWTDRYKLQKQVDFMEGHPDCSVCAHNSLVYNTNANHLRAFVTKHLQKEDYDLASFLQMGWFTATQSLLYRSDALPKLNPPQQFMQGDYYLLLRLLLKENSYLHYSNEVMGIYRDGGWASSNYDEIKLRDSFIALLQFMKEQSNHRCDELFDKAIGREQQNKQNVFAYQSNLKKANSLFVKFGHWLCRCIVWLVNRYVPCLHISKEVKC